MGRSNSIQEKRGLPSNKILGIIKDRSGNLWLSTDNGLAKFELDSKQFQIYKKSDGLQSNEFIGNSYLKSRDGTFYFGGYNGLTAFKPEDIKKNLFTPPVIITSITVYPGEEKINRDLLENNKLLLSYKDTTVLVAFSSLDYRNHKNNQYAYKIEPLNKDWDRSKE